MTVRANPLGDSKIDQRGIQRDKNGYLFIQVGAGIVQKGTLQPDVLMESRFKNVIVQRANVLAPTVTGNMSDSHADIP